MSAGPTEKKESGSGWPAGAACCQGQEIVARGVINTHFEPLFLE